MVCIISFEFKGQICIKRNKMSTYLTDWITDSKEVKINKQTIGHKLHILPQHKKKKKMLTYEENT